MPHRLRIAERAAEAVQKEGPTMHYPSGIQAYAQSTVPSKLNVEANPRTGTFKVFVDNPDVATGFLAGFLAGAVVVAAVALVSSQKAA